MLGFARDVAFGTRWCFQGLCVTSSKSSLFHCRFFWTIVHTSCWASDSAFFKKTRFAMLFLRKSVLLGLALRETKAFFLVPFRRFSSNDKWPQRDVALVKLLLQLPRLVHCIAKIMIRVSFIGTKELS